jgi:hypothetical protein
MVNDDVLTEEAPPLTRVRASNWVGGDVDPAV